MTNWTRVLRPAAWLFYVIFVFEILFMISPAALYFYAAYGPTLNFLDRAPATTWLTQFFLPHISVTASPALNALGRLGGPLIVAGGLIFVAGAVPLYWAKLRRRGAVTGGLYRFVRHPQYLGLAAMGFGTLLLWPRFLVLIALVTMLFLYGLLARWEEAQCLARFGDSYRAYQARTGMFLPRLVSVPWPRLLPAAGPTRAITAVALYIVVTAAAVGLAFAIRDYSLSQVAAIYRPDVAILSPVRLTEAELDAAYRTAAGDERVKAKLSAASAAKLIVHVVPEGARLPDLPLEAKAPTGGHHTPASFDRNRLRVLFSRPRTHDPQASGVGIVKAAHRLDPIVVARVDIAAGMVAAVDAPPKHVYWGDIPTPMF